MLCIPLLVVWSWNELLPLTRVGLRCWIAAGSYCLPLHHAVSLQESVSDLRCSEHLALFRRKWEREHFSAAGFNTWYPHLLCTDNELARSNGIILYSKPLTWCFTLQLTTYSIITGFYRFNLKRQSASVCALRSVQMYAGYNHAQLTRKHSISGDTFYTNRSHVSVSSSALASVSLIH